MKVMVLLQMIMKILPIQLVILLLQMIMKIPMKVMVLLMERELVGLFKHIEDLLNLFINFSKTSLKIIEFLKSSDNIYIF